MFGQPDDQQVVNGAAQPAQNPSMLDNVSTQDLQGQPAADPAQSTNNPAQGVQTPDPAAQSFAQQHPLTSDNPFTDPAATTAPQPVAPSPAAPVAADPAQPATPVVDPVASPSQPAPAPVFQVDDSSAQPTTSPATDPQAPSDVDHDKLATMKQEAMGHLEPLVDHIDGTPEETFKTTMMMIQANDNHTLLDKALEAAKNISDDKDRAEALLDIINEINYFSQAQQPASNE